MKKIIATALALVMCLSIMSMVAFAAAPSLDSLAIVGENIPGVPSWAPEAPEGDMTKVSDGVYEKVLECPAGTNMNFKIAGNDKWDDTCNFGSATLTLGEKADLECSGGSGNMNLTFSKATKIKITVDVNPMNDGGAATILVEEVKSPDPTTPTTPTQPTTTTKPATTTQPTTTAKPTNRTLTVKVPSSWATVNIYSWEPEEHGAWPGSALQKSGDAYKTTIKSSTLKLVLSTTKADGTPQQTNNIILEDNGKNVTITVKDDATFDIKYDGQNAIKRFDTETKPAATKVDGANSVYRVVGGGAWLGDWNAASDLGLMKEVETGLFRKNFTNVQPGTYELKITKDGKWDVSYGDGAEGKDNCKFTVDSACTITVDFYIKDDIGYIRVYGEGVPPITADISMVSVVVLMALASVTAIVLVVNKKKFI